MSNAVAYVRFPDGTVMYNEYNGTADYCYPKLYATFDDLGRHWRHNERGTCTCGRDPEPVDYWCTYGGGELLRLTACRHCGLMAEEWCDPDGMWSAYERGLAICHGTPDRRPDDNNVYQTPGGLPPDDWPLVTDHMRAAGWREPPWVAALHP